MQLQCEVDGYPIPQVAWFKDDQPLEASQRVAISGMLITLCTRDALNA
jgi:hypothetical protein